MACYNEEIFENPDDLSESFTCPIGLGVFRDPVTDPCGHTFCRECIEKSIEQFGTCPFSKISLDSNYLHPNDNIADFIDEFPCKCENFENSCSWTGIIKDIQSHLEECEYHEVKCQYEGCKKMTMRKDLDSHLEICTFQPVKCQHCCLKIRKFEINSHNINSCQEFEHLCSFGCEEKVKRKYFNFHKVYVCSKVKRIGRVEFKDAEKAKFSDFF